MHTYSIDKKIRTTLAVSLFVVSISISVLLRKLLSPTIDTVTVWLTTNELKSLADFISATGIFPNFLEAAFVYSLLSFFYEKWVWKCPLIRSLHGVPNLNGHWEGELSSSNCVDQIQMELDIKQTWSQISFKSTFPNSSSCSNTAAIYMNDNRGISIYFGFHNDSTDIKTGMRSYDGYNILTLDSKNTISARYFNNRSDPQNGVKGGNIGHYTLHKKE